VLEILAPHLKANAEQSGTLHTARQRWIFVSRESTVLGQFDDQGEIASQVPITVKDLRERLGSMLAHTGRLGTG
jgi:hypothetical protein